MIPTVGDNMEQVELSYIANGDLNGNTTLKNCQDLLKLNIHLPYEPGTYTREIHIFAHWKASPAMSQEYLWQIYS